LLQFDGTAWAWGAQGSGQIGDNQTATTRSSPVSVVGAHSFAKIAGGSTHSLGLKSSDGTLWAWGLNTSGQLGDNTLTNRSSPTSVVGAHSFTTIAGGITHSAALKSDGTAWVWGAAANGQIGDNQTATNRSSPTSVVGAHSFTKIFCGNTRTVALKADGTIWGWGLNTSGQIGDNTATNKSSPVLVIGQTLVHSFTSTIASSFNTTLILKSDNTVWGWGLNTSGEIGDNTATTKSSPVSQVGGHSFTAFGSGQSHSLGLKSDGNCWAWGIGTNGQLGDNTVTTKSSPVAVVGAHSFTFIAQTSGALSYALKSNGSAWAWGIGTNGQIGDNTATTKSSPTSVVGAHSFTKIAGGASHAIAVKGDGTCWGWGANAGQIGDNTNTNRSSPVSVVGNHSFISVAAGTVHSLALKADGTIWAWGTNSNNQLGDGTTTNRSSPILVVGNHSFTSIAAKQFRSAALRGDGAIYIWGDIGTEITDRSIPTSVARILN